MRYELVLLLQPVADSSVSATVNVGKLIFLSELRGVCVKRVWEGGCVLTAGFYK